MIMNTFAINIKLQIRLKNRFKNISQNYVNLKSKKFYSEENIKKLIYLSGKESVMDLLLFQYVQLKSCKI